ncbi:MAG TPA: PepSY-associated TM helix domain-containing protein [Acidobacteriota bacterium]|nr:PepSY-associated TM helix domain-containing protein [Acidobacteriota bacterium]
MRKTLLQLHLWPGLVLGLLLAGSGVTGAVLAWRTELDRNLHRALYVVTPQERRMNLDKLVTRAQAARPGAQIEDVRLLEAADAPVIVGFADDVYAHLDPYDGRVLGLRARYGDALGWVDGFHKYLRLRPAIGETITGTSAVGFVVVILTGVALWWPKTRRALKVGATFNWRLRGRPWHLGLHRTLGFYVAVVVLVSAVTGTPIAFKRLRQWIVGRAPEPVARTEAGEGFVGFDTLAKRVRELMPAARECFLTVPRRGVVKAYAIAADAPHANARSYVWMNQSDGAVLRYAPYVKATLGFRLYYWLLSLHTGEIGGWPVRLLLTLGALAVPVLVFAGAASFALRKFRRTPAASLGASGSAGEVRAV